MKAAWKFLELLMAIRFDPRYKQAVDAMLDPLEEIYQDNERVLRYCQNIRDFLDVPDND